MTASLIDTKAWRTVTESGSVVTTEGLVELSENSNIDVGGRVVTAETKSVRQFLDDAPVSKFHHKAVIISGMGFFTDAYDLFVIGTVAAILKTQWNLSTIETSWATGAAILGAFFGAFVFARIADIVGRKKIYIAVAVIMVLGALASSLAPGFLFLVFSRFVLGL